MKRRLINDNDVQELYEKGLSDREIGRRLGFSHRPVSDARKRLGLESKQPKSITLVIDEKGFCNCSKCNEKIKYEDFPLLRKNTKYEYKLSYCQKCRTKQCYQATTKDIDTFLIHRWNSLKNKAKYRGQEFKLTLEDVKKLYNFQSGKCFYTNTIMTWGLGKNENNQNSISFDRMNTNEGYTPENVVLCCYRINRMKGDATLDEMKKWMPNWYKRIEKKLK